MGCQGKCDPWYKQGGAIAQNPLKLIEWAIAQNPLSKGEPTIVAGEAHQVGGQQTHCTELCSVAENRRLKARQR